MDWNQEIGTVRVCMHLLINNKLQLQQHHIIDDHLPLCINISHSDIHRCNGLQHYVYVYLIQSDAVKRHVYLHIQIWIDESRKYSCRNSVLTSGKDAGANGRSIPRATWFYYPGIYWQNCGYCHVGYHHALIPPYHHIVILSLHHTAK